MKQKNPQNTEQYHQYFAKYKYAKYKVNIILFLNIQTDYYFAKYKFVFIKFRKIQYKYFAKYKVEKKKFRKVQGKNIPQNTVTFQKISVKYRKKDSA